MPSKQQKSCCKWSNGKLNGVSHFFPLTPHHLGSVLPFLKHTLPAGSWSWLRASAACCRTLAWGSPSLSSPRTLQPPTPCHRYPGHHYSALRSWGKSIQYVKLLETESYSSPSGMKSHCLWLTVEDLSHRPPSYLLLLFFLILYFTKTTLTQGISHLLKAKHQYSYSCSDVIQPVGALQPLNNHGSMNFFLQVFLYRITSMMLKCPRS